MSGVWKIQPKGLYKKKSRKNKQKKPRTRTWDDTRTRTRSRYLGLGFGSGSGPEHVPGGGSGGDGLCLFSRDEVNVGHQRPQTAAGKVITDPLIVNYRKQTEVEKKNPSWYKTSSFSNTDFGSGLSSQRFCDEFKAKKKKNRVPLIEYNSRIKLTLILSFVFLNGYI